MDVESGLVSLVKFGVPIQSSYRKLLVDSELYIASSVVFLDDRASDDRYFFSGTSVKRDRDLAVLVSQVELMERVFAFPLLHKRVDHFCSRDIFNHSVLGNVSPERVLLTKKGPIEQDGSIGVGASGLGAGQSLQDAIDHGFRECIERHIRVSVWQGDLPLVRFVAPECIADRFLLESFSLPDAFDIPFVLSVITSRKGEAVFFVGSSVSIDHQTALQHARAEALMHLDTYVSNRRGLANTIDSRVRFLTLIGGGAEELHRRFKQMVQEEQRTRSSLFNASEPLRCLKYDSSESIQYVLLAALEDFYLVRVFSERFRDESWLRCVTRDPDPFC